jgi:surfeit locus 1 family protein
VIRIGPYALRTRWWAVLVALVLAGFLASLGVWQLQRAEEKRAIVAEQERRAAEPVTSLDPTPQDPAEWRFRLVEVAGYYLGDRQFLLDNQVRRGQVGYNVLTPFRLADSGALVLVDRGWVPQGPRRDLLPDVGVTEVGQHIVAQVYVPFGEAYRLGTLDEGEAGWPRRVQYLGLDELGERLGEPLAPMVLRLDPQAEHGYLREWDTVPFTPERHIAYALQWFGLAIVLLVVFVAAQLRRVD